MKRIFSIFFIGFLAFSLSLPLSCKEKIQVTTGYKVVCRECGTTIREETDRKTVPSSEKKIWELEIIKGLCDECRAKETEKSDEDKAFEERIAQAKAQQNKSESSDSSTTSSGSANSAQSSNTISSAEQEMNDYYSALGAVAEKFEPYTTNYGTPISNIPDSLWNELWELNIKIERCAETNPGVSGGDKTLALMGAINHLTYVCFGVGDDDAAKAYYLILNHYPNSPHRSDAMKALSEMGYDF